MKKTVTREVDCCDECGKEVEYSYSCMRCGAIYCHGHDKSVMVSYPHSIYCTGSGDGHYCKKCNAELMASGGDPLFLSYLRIADLRKENERTYADFKRRADHAEATCKKEYEKNRAGK